jgi:transcriptional regulator with XRE-family HTH domain
LHKPTPGTQVCLEKLGRAIREQRLKRGLSQEELAELADVHPTYIGKVERAQKNVSFENLLKIATALNMTVCELFALARV